MKICSGLLEGQVLQRINPKFAGTIIQGETKAEGAVFATLFNGKKAVTGWKKKKVGQATNGFFTAKLDKLPVGGAYSLKLETGKESALIKEFYVGDVWLLAGQSNMEGIGNLEDAPEPHPFVRAFYMDRKWRLAKDPLHVLGESPDTIHRGLGVYDPAAARKARYERGKGTGVGVYFAKEMIKRSGGVPQGLVCTAHGGTSMSQWDPALKDKGGESLYGSMLLSIRACGQPYAGVLWYQGESDADPVNAPLYTDRMKKLVAEVRSDLKQPKLPWIIVQIARVLAPDSPHWDSIQEQERNLHKHIAHFEAVSAIDLGLDDGIHISGKEHGRLGVRMARLADRLAYKNTAELPAPDFAAITSTKLIKTTWEQRIEVTFKNVVGGLTSLDRPAGFTLLNSEHKPLALIYKAVPLGNKIILESKYSPDGVYLSYAYGANPFVNITDVRDMPIPAFGPIRAFKPIATSPFVKKWWVSDTVPAVKPLDKIELPDKASLKLEKKDFTISQPGLDGFINMHDRWMQERGHAFFFTEIEAPEDMNVNVGMGYDGPFRIWIDGKPLFIDMKGINPCIPDKNDKKTFLSKGKHEVAVGMDLNNGGSWGFFLRFKRPDVPTAKVETGDYLVPVVP